MITPDEAQALAKKLMQDYVKACGCDTQEDVGNVLMKLASVVGVGMCAVVGQSEAVARLAGTAAHISKPEFARPWVKGMVQ